MIILGVDIGGTAVKLGLINGGGQLSEFREYDLKRDSNNFMDQVITSIDSYVTEVLPDNPVLDGIGVSATGQIDKDTGIVIGTAGHIPGYEGANIKRILQDKYSLPVTVANDANCMVLGEKWIGAGKGYDDIVSFTIGTGIGGGIVVGGKLLEGARGLAGELGHFSIEYDGIGCSCGSRGCFEKYASTTSLVEQVSAAVPGVSWNGRSIFTEYDMGSPVISRIVEAWIEKLARTVVSLVHLFNPQIVIIGGGVSEQQELLISPIRNYVYGHAMPRFTDGLMITNAKLGNRAGLIGGVKYHLDKLNPIGQ